jgi:lipoprotein signal peptidase
MMKALVLGTILGGLVAFVWSSVSWEVIGWHEKTMVKFQNEDEVSAVIASHAPVDGTYLLPAGPSTDGMTPDQKKATQAATMEKMQKGPIVFATVRRGGFGSFSRGLIIQLLSLMAAAFLLTWLLLQTSGLSYARSVAFLAIVGLSASVIVDLPNWNWWGFSGAYTAVNLADSTITWLLAGLVIAKVAKPKTS